MNVNVLINMFDEPKMWIIDIGMVKSLIFFKRESWELIFFILK